MIRYAAAFGAAFLLAGCEQASLPKAEKAKPPSAKVEMAKPKTAIFANGLGVYGTVGMGGAIKEALEKRGWKVTILNHTQVKYLTHMPRVLIGHSMGANAALKRSQKFIRNHPDLIVSIDAGRAPLFHRAPESKARVVDISCPYHPIGGQRIVGADVYREVCGTAHIAMPHDKRVIDIIIKEVEALQ